MFLMTATCAEKTTFLHKLLLTNKQVANLRQVFANNLTSNTKLSKTRISKIMQSGGFLKVHLNH